MLNKTLPLVEVDGTLILHMHMQVNPLHLLTPDLPVLLLLQFLLSLLFFLLFVLSLAFAFLLWLLLLFL